MKIKYLITLMLINICYIQNLFSQNYTYNIKIAAHIVRYSQGQYGIDPADVTTSIQQVNTVYTTYNTSDIHFELAYYDFIDSDTYTTGEVINFEPTDYVFQQKLQYLFSEKNNVGVIHVYFIKKSFTTGAYAGVSEDIPGYKIVITNEDAINGVTLSHEIGHCLGLLHSYEGIKFNIQPDNGQFWSNEGIPNQPEWVARQRYSCSNSITNGDLLDDTPADPIFDEGGISKFIQNCNFHNNNNIRDNSSCQNLYTGVLINNIMAFPACCSRWQFTNGQKARMKAFLDDRLKSINNVLAVVVANKSNGATIPNTIDKPSNLTIDAFNYNSGSTIYLNQVSHSGKTNQERFVNYQSGNIKHHDWNNTSSEFKLSQNFTPTTLSPFRDANFLNMIYSKIEARLEGSFFSGKGDFQFQDPWYALSDNSQPVNYWISGSGMYEPTGKAGATERGIFLNQTPDPNNPNKPYYSVKAISPQSISLNGRIHNFYFLNWGGENVSYEHSNQAETGVVFTDENAVANANMKGTQLSNAVTAYENNSQRKFIRTPDQYYHHVYESMGTVWYERSSDNGQTWYLMNNGMPLELLGNAKSPSIDYLNNENVQCVVITYQRKTSTGSQVVAVIFDNGTRKYTYGLDSFAHPEIEYEEHNAAPVVAISYFSTTDNPQVLFVWKKPGLLPDESYPENEVPALYFSFGYLTRDYYQTSYSLNWHSQNLKKRIPTTDRFSLTPSMAIHKYNFESHFQLAYEQNSQIYYWHCYYVWSAPGALFYGSPENVSSGCGFSSNTKPSIIAANQYFAHVCWIGYRNTEPWQNEEGGEGGMPKVGVETEGTEQKVVFCDPDYKDHFWNFGVNVNSTNINKSIPKYVIAWSEGNNNGLIKFTDNTTLGGTINETPNDLTGNYVQVSNAELDIVDMKIMSFNTNAQPFYFNSDQCYSTAKIKSLAIGTGREGVVSKDSARFYFALGDLEVNGQRVDFIEVDDTVSIYSNQRLNDLLISQPFNLNDNTNFVYSVQYGITDSLAAVYVLDNDDFVNFKVELRDNQTEELLGLFDNITYTKINVAQYNNIAYQVNTQGIGNRTVRLKLVTDNNFNPKYSMADRYAQNNALLKTSHKQVSFKGSLAVDNYDLSQNYPNPFNPTTTINYQIKEDGLVTLKLYDILGSEVITLVNEDKTKGRYSYNFNASDLASGVYIYQLRVNDFVSAKKLMLLK